MESMSFTFLSAVTVLVVAGCDRSDFRNGYSPGDVETSEAARVYHLADGVLIQESQNGRNCYYLIESTVADWELTARGLDIVLEGEKAGTYSTTPAPQGYVAAWITEVEGDGPGVTRFHVDEATLVEVIGKLEVDPNIRASVSGFLSGSRRAGQWL